MHILFWVDTFPSFSETFIRDQIIHILNQNAQITIHTKNGKINTSELESLSGFEKYNLQDKVVPIDTLFPTNKLIRVLLFIKIVLQYIFSKNLKFYLKSLQVNKFGAEAKSLKLFFKMHFILKNKIDVIHAHFGPNGNEAVVLKKLGLPIKLFTTFHGYDIRLGLEKENDLYKDLFTYTDGIFSISNFNTNCLLKFGAPKNKILQLANGIDLEFFKRTTPILNSNKIKIITVARLVEEKALHISIHSISEVLKKIPDLDFVYHIIGEGNKREELQNMIDVLKLTRKIKLVGAKNSVQVRDLMISSDLFLLSSKSEALPTVLLEAQACGLVLLATDVGSVRDIVKSGIVVEPENVKAFSKGLENLINNKEQWDVLAEGGRNFISKEHNINKQTQKLIQFYKQ